MRNRLMIAGVAAVILFALESKPVRIAVIGGMTMTPLWGETQKRFESETGIRVEVAVTGYGGSCGNCKPGMDSRCCSSLII